MPQTVASHQVAAFTTPINGATTDANVVRGNDNTLRTGYVNHDADPGIHLQSSTLASRPAFGSAGRKWLTADTGSYRLFFDTGSAWQELSYLRTDAGGTVLAQTTFSVTGNPQILSTDGTVTQFVGYADTNVAYSGTQTNHAYALLTNNVERVRVLNGGNVGIGTATPSALLHVAGTFLATGAATFNGNVTLGNATSDSVTVTGRLASSIVPDTGNTYPLGDTSLPFSQVHSRNFFAIDSGSSSYALTEYTRHTVSTATNIGGIPLQPTQFLVAGDAGGDSFFDVVVMASVSDSPVVVTSTTTRGSPAARTYTQSGSRLRLAMSSGTYAVSVVMTAMQNY